MLYLVATDPLFTQRWKNILEAHETVCVHTQEALESLHVKSEDVALVLWDDFPDYMHHFPVVFALHVKPSLEIGATLLKQGVKGYGNAYLPFANLTMAVESLLGGNIWVYPELMNYLITHVNVPSMKKEDALALLSNKEKAVAELIAQGLSNKEISLRLGNSERTIKTHISSIYKKTNTNDRVSLSLLIRL